MVLFLASQLFYLLTHSQTHILTRLFFCFFLRFLVYTGGALLGAYGGRSPCVRTLRPDQESIVLETAKERSKENKDNRDNKDNEDIKNNESSKGHKNNEETSSDPIPGKIPFLSTHNSPYIYRIISFVFHRIFRLILHRILYRVQ